MDEVAREATAAYESGVRGVILFGLPETKDETASGAYADKGIVQQATGAVRKAVPDMIVIADTCLCEYTSHGHCGVVRRGEILNDESLELLARTAVSQAEAGADIVAPSAMMDGQVGRFAKPWTGRVWNNRYHVLRGQVRLSFLWAIS